MMIWSLEVQPTFFTVGFTNHHFLIRDLSSSKMKQHFLFKNGEEVSGSGSFFFVLEVSAPVVSSNLPGVK